MSAGTGVTHSEFNSSTSEMVHLLQIWLFPEKRGLEPGYEQNVFPRAERKNRLRLIASHDAADGSLKIHQDVRLYASVLDSGREMSHELHPGRHAWLQLTLGELTINGVGLKAGDGAMVSEESGLIFKAITESEFILFDLA